MNSPMSAQKFLKSEEASLARKELRKMMADTRFNTQSTYSPSSSERLLFVDRHMKYLSVHVNLNPNHYIANLKLMTRISR